MVLPAIEIVINLISFNLKPKEAFHSLIIRGLPGIRCSWKYPSLCMKDILAECDQTVEQGYWSMFTTNVYDNVYDSSCILLRNRSVRWGGEQSVQTFCRMRRGTVFTDGLCDGEGNSLYRRSLGWGGERSVQTVCGMRRATVFVGDTDFTGNRSSPFARSINATVLALH
ncbi:unnamed protein product [Nesidiocoris tenuis]|uniref:Uncharacterized protein n=1 Tax=Nesidiocoris tenuis TaxID=355587 RepID=A0A6H5HCS0_9HEMI|nr:unnamed protein product [Nesidiocoris tenuis]